MSKSNALSLPLDATLAQKYMPHRGRMFWIDQVNALFEAGGETQIELKAKAAYFSGRQLRASSYIEFMAQTHAVVSITHALMQERDFQLKEAFLAGIGQFEYALEANPCEGEKLFVQVTQERELGPFSFISGQVFDAERSQILAQAKLKLYSLS